LIGNRATSVSGTHVAFAISTKSLVLSIAFNYLNKL
jgi:hypothetical protein